MADEIAVPTPEQVANHFRDVQETEAEKLRLYARDFFGKVSTSFQTYNGNIFKLLDFQGRELAIVRPIMYHLRNDTITIDILRDAIIELDALNAEVQREYPSPSQDASNATVNE